MRSKEKKSSEEKTDIKQQINTWLPGNPHHLFLLQPLKQLFILVLQKSNNDLLKWFVPVQKKKRNMANIVHY